MNLAADSLSRARAPSTLPALVTAGSRLLGLLGVLAMLASVIIEVVGRSFLGHATIWVTEVTTYLVVAITFVGAPFVVSRNANVRVDLVLDRLSPERRDAVLKALSWLSVFVALTVLWKVTGLWAENLKSGTRSWSLLNTPLWIPQSAVVVGLTGVVIALAGSAASRSGLAGYGPLAAALLFAILGGTGLVSAGLSPHLWVLVLAGLTGLSAYLASGGRAVIVAACVTGPAVGLFVATADMALASRSAAMVAALFVLLFSGLPVVFCLFAVGLFAMLFWLPPVSLNVIGERTWEAVNTFEFAAIPMFVMMGAVLVRSNASGEMFAATRLAMGRLKGGLAYASILASGIFAAVSGSSLATAATMGRVAGPEMLAERYRAELAYGVLAAGGTLGILIPPSIAMIVYGPMAGVPVTELFMAGIVPGLLMIAAFALVVLLWTALDGTAAPAGQGYALREKLLALRGVAPFLALMILVLGSLYAGIATPTEAGAVGVVGALGISLARGTLTLRSVVGALEEAALATSFLLMIAVGSAVMSFAVDFLSMPQELVRLITWLNLSDIGLFVAIVILFLILGMFVEPISMVLMTLPILLPVITAAGWDPLWFGIVLVMLVEIGLITPPVGMILYVLAGVSDQKVSLGRISVGTLPFVGAFLAMALLFFAMPELVTFLPELVR
ncbi:TRAP transporter large permease subunit [Polymorphum gilvum]|uniref:Putative membrane protein n=1 Tax=Polymorphum gilvum (strain LMG 25793 / CGMCC 1.9160 / SL003B-26A1) TaxID=991905 RepID=F2J3Y5_POLGS|nr:TRAP transporter large permease subunit [Polymorphum gilvum]ADZ68967.1 Putative membrane protein [Polymorphum gilvum SL003B-26A1]